MTSMFCSIALANAARTGEALRVEAGGFLGPGVRLSTCGPFHVVSCRLGTTYELFDGSWDCKGISLFGSKILWLTGWLVWEEIIRKGNGMCMRCWSGGEAMQDHHLMHDLLVSCQ